jgi:hypothetical protein
MSDANNDNRLGDKEAVRQWRRDTHPDHFGSVRITAEDNLCKHTSTTPKTGDITPKGGDLMEPFRPCETVIYNGNEHILIKNELADMELHPLAIDLGNGRYETFTYSGRRSLNTPVELTRPPAAAPNIGAKSDFDQESLLAAFRALNGRIDGVETRGTPPSSSPELPPETKKEQSIGVKADNGKPQISLIPTEAILEMATAFAYGANKYSADNFKHGIKYRRLLDAALRHILAISAGEDLDSESGNSHLGHALASLAMLAYMMKNKPEFDDRFKG